MDCATNNPDIYSVERRPFCLDRDCPTVRRTVIFTLGTLLIAAAIAACITVFSEWADAAFFPANTKPDADVASGLARDLEEPRIAVATPTPATAFLAESPFAHGSGLLFLSEPVGSEASRASGFGLAQQPSPEIVVAALLPFTAPADEQQIKAPLPRPRPFAYQQDTQAKIYTADSANVAATPKTSAADAPAAPSASPTFMQNLVHFWHALNETKLPPEVDSHTAVYDIQGHVVYLPNGEKLEAHSGMGNLLDDVRYVKEKGRGPTPPNIYQLALRKSLFHGVQAIRLNPVDGSKMYGREGILAHPYMLGPDGQSNGCISVQDYPKFLEAYLNGKFDRLIVVPKVGDTTSYAANAPAQDDKRYASQ
jgi:hypothetical protein